MKTSERHALASWAGEVRKASNSHPEVLGTKCRRGEGHGEQHMRGID